MLQSKIFSKTLKAAPKNEKSTNAKLLVRAGFVDKLMSGVYSYLPLGLRSLKKIENIIREEMNKIGGQEVFLPSLHPKENWEVTDRFKYEEMFKLKGRNEKEYGLGWTHEEVVVPLLQKFVRSYKDLPVYLYQIQTKFRNELRAKSGLLRGIEFLMKDLYSFHKNEEDLDKYYEKVKNSYFKIFARCGLEKQTFLTYASGGAFSKYSHEFQTITDNGEDEIYLCPNCKLAINKEIIEQEKYKCSKCHGENLETKKAIEVGNIFKLRARFSEPFNFTFKDERGEEKFVLMGCYGIGLGRLLGAVVEVNHDEKGIIWPGEISPFDVHLIQIGDDNEIRENAEKLYEALEGTGKEVLYDERTDATPGEKLVDADLIGIPTRMVVSKKTLERDSVEIKNRKKEKPELLKIKEVKKFNLFS